MNPIICPDGDHVGGEWHTGQALDEYLAMTRSERPEGSVIRTALSPPVYTTGDASTDATRTVPTDSSTEAGLANRKVREYLGEAYMIKGRPDLAKAQLATIKGLCGTGCEEYRDLSAAIDGIAQAQFLQRVLILRRNLHRNFFDRADLGVASRLAYA